MVFLHQMGLAVDPDLQGAVDYHNQFVDGVGVQWRSGARFSGIDAEGAGDSLLAARHIPFAVARPPGNFRRLLVVDDWHGAISRKIGHCLATLYDICGSSGGQV